MLTTDFLYKNIRQQIRLLLALFILCTSFELEAQKISRDVVAAAAETVKTQGISVTFVLGEAVGDLFGSFPNSRFFTAGFNQPDVELKEVLDQYPNTNFIIYNNPTRTGLAKLAFNKMPNGTYTVQVIDALGRTLQQIQTKISSNMPGYIDINVAGYASGVYLLRIQSDVSLRGELKLIKQ